MQVRIPKDQGNAKRPVIIHTGKIEASVEA